MLLSAATHQLLCSLCDVRLYESGAPGAVIARALAQPGVEVFAKVGQLEGPTAVDFIIAVRHLECAKRPLKAYLGGFALYYRVWNSKSIRKEFSSNRPRMERLGASGSRNRRASEHTSAMKSCRTSYTRCFLSTIFPSTTEHLKLC
jgi:hypothetical protein